jgi:hypothetical protein
MGESNRGRRHPADGLDHCSEKAALGLDLRVGGSISFCRESG